MKKIFLIIILLLNINIYPQTYVIPLTNAEITNTLLKAKDSVVTLANTQTIIGQKNFLGTIKISDDSSWSFEKNTINQLIKTIPNTSSRYRYLRFPLSGNSFHDEFALQFFATPQNEIAPNYVMSLGYNPNQTKPSVAQWIMNFESYWRPSQDTTDRWSEWYLQYSQPNTSVGLRPISAVVSWVNNYTQAGFTGDRIGFEDRATSKKPIEYVSNGDAAGYSSNKSQLLFGGYSAYRMNNIQYRFNLPKDSSAWFFNDIEYFRLRNNVIGNEALAINAGQRRGIMIGANYSDPYSSINIYVDNYSGEAQGVIRASTSMHIRTKYFEVHDTTGVSIMKVRNDGAKYITLGSSHANGIYDLYAGGLYIGTTQVINSSRNIFSNYLQLSGSLTGGAVNSVRIGSTNISTNNTILDIYTEGGDVVGSTALTSPDKNIAVRINGTIYYIPAKTTRD